MKLYSIKRKETGQTLREYISSFKLSQYEYGPKLECLGDFSINVKRLQENQFTYLVSEKGTPGLCYSAGWDGMCVCWLDTKFWEVEFRKDVLEKRKVV